MVLQPLLSAVISSGGGGGGGGGSINSGKGPVKYLDHI
jgi:hypothetical protein